MRRIEKLMDGWTFVDGHGQKTVLDLPHTWNAKDGQDGGNDYWRGTCTYEKRVKKPDLDQNQRVYLQFHGVNASAKILLNGNHVCSHHGGYSTFRADVTDPIIGALIDKTSTKFGKFRPYMVLGNVIMAVSSILLYFGTRIIAEDMMWLKYTMFVLFYALYVIGYTFQTACTRSGQTCLTNDPNQRPLFTIFNTVASLIGMGSIIVGFALAMIGISELPDSTTPYAPGMNWVVIALFCVIPMLTWIATLWATKGYTLTGPRMKEIQAVNAQRKEAIAGGMSLEKAMEAYQ